MASNEDASPPPTGRERRKKHGAVFSPIVWIQVVGGVLILLGVIIGDVLSLSGFVVVQLNHYSIATRSWYKVGVLLFAFGWFAFIAIPGALMVHQHPWAPAARRIKSQGDSHERLFGLTMV